jgi:lipopolysaccharide export system protein LptA
MYATQIRILRACAAGAFACWAVCTLAQSEPQAGGQVEILNADRWDFNKDVATGAQRLSGHVRFRQDAALMSCDSAWLYEDHRVSAFGNVDLRQGDTLHITGDRLQYSGKEHLATMLGQVVLSDPGMELITEVLAYNVKDRRAEYHSGATITDKRGGNRLNSIHGIYLAGSHVFIFSDQVRLEHPERTITADSLQYSTTTGVALFHGPTHITQGPTRMYCERGSFDTRTGKGRFVQAGRIIDGAQELTGDSLHYDRNTGEGTGWGHVTITDTLNHVLVHGDYGTHRQMGGRSMITGRAEMVMLVGKDSLHLHADTLFAQQDSTKGRRITARRNVRFYKGDLQGVCDTMVYDAMDSVIALRGRPYIWSKSNQLSGDTVFIQLSHGHAEKLTVDGAALMIEQVDSIHFNQVAGTTLTGFFKNDEINRLIAEGNSRTIYFTKEKQDSTERITGVNRADCSRITVGLDSGQVNTVSFITQPDGTMYPLDQAPSDALRFEGFFWNAAARPLSHADIFRKVALDGSVPGPMSGLEAPIR